MKTTGTENILIQIGQKKLTDTERSGTVSDKEQKYRILFESMRQGVFYQDSKGVFLDVNSAALEILGLTREGFLGRTASTLEWRIIDEDGKLLEPEEFPSAVSLISGKKIIDKIVGVFNPVKKMFRWVMVSALPQFSEYEKFPCEVMVILHDITEWKNTEIYRNLFSEIFRSLNDSFHVTDSLTRIIRIIKQGLDLDAVGIRLRDPINNDYTFTDQVGFSTEFLINENLIVTRNKEGFPCRDKNGNYSLECTCGLVISGRTDPSISFFTKGGSVWTNDSSELLNISPDQDIRINPRNRCIHEGYNSIAIIPVRENKNIIGLLLLNSKKKNCFTLEKIHFLESLTSSIGIALKYKQMVEDLHKSENLLSTSQKVGNIGSFVFDLSSDLLTGTKIFEEIYGIDKNYNFSFKGWMELIHPDWRDSVNEYFKNEVIGKHQKFEKEFKIIRFKDGQERWISTIAKLDLDKNNNPLKLTGIVNDISEHKYFLETIRETERRFRETLENVSMLTVGIDNLCCINFVNEHFLSITGWQRDEIIGKNWINMVLPEDIRDKARQVFSSFISTGKFLVHETSEIITRQREERIISWNNTILRDINGKAIGLIRIGEDITEKKRIEIKVHQQLDEIQRWYDITTDRENRIIELKKEVNELLEKDGNPLRYEIFS